MALIRLTPKQLPKQLDTFVAADTETSGLYPDSGHRVSTVSLAWTQGSEIVRCAFPFHQGLVVRGQPKPELERADFGWTKDDPVQIGFYKNGKPRYKAQPRRKFTVAEKMAKLGPDPNLSLRDWDTLVDWLLSVPGLVWHNALFDCVMMTHGTPDFPGVELLNHTVWDTMLAQRVLDGEHLVGLKENMERQFGIKPDERDALKEHLKELRLPSGTGVRYDLASWEVMEDYAAKDTEFTLMLAKRQYRRFSQGEARFERMNTLLDRMATLYRMEMRGVPYDPVESLRWAEKLEARVEELGDTFPFNPTGPQAAEFFFGVGRTKKDKPCLGLKPVKVTDAGNPSLDSEVTDVLAQRDVPWAKAWREYALVKDTASKYYRGYAEATGPDGRLRTRFRQLGTKAWRLSCERVNLQAIPHDHRLLAGGSAILGEAPSPRALSGKRPGYRIFGMDLAQAELRVAALYANCVPMLEILFDGRDPHGETAISLGLSKGPEDTESKFDWFKARSVLAKRSNFSLIFGVGPKKFREDLRKQSGIDFGESTIRKIHKDWNALYPEFKEAIDIHMRIARKDGRTLVRDDVYRYYTELERQCYNCKKTPCKCGGRADDLHKAFNQRVQGNLGEFCQEWMVRADEYLMDHGLGDGDGLLLQVHDALYVMVPEGEEQLAEDCAQIARDMWGEWFPGVPGGVDVHEGV